MPTSYLESHPPTAWCRGPRKASNYYGLCTSIAKASTRYALDHCKQLPHSHRLRARVACHKLKWHCKHYHWWIAACGTRPSASGIACPSMPGRAQCIQTYVVHGPFREILPAILHTHCHHLPGPHDGLVGLVPGHQARIATLRVVVAQGLAPRARNAAPPLPSCGVALQPVVQAAWPARSFPRLRGDGRVAPPTHLSIMPPLSVPPGGKEP